MSCNVTSCNVRVTLRRVTLPCNVLRSLKINLKILSKLKNPKLTKMTDRVTALRKKGLCPKISIKGSRINAGSLCRKMW